METVVSRVRIAQAAAQVGVDPATATQMLANRARHPIAVEYFGDNNRNSVPLVCLCIIYFYVFFLSSFFLFFLFLIEQKNAFLFFCLYVNSYELNHARIRLLISH